jgi:hypothetical protein
VATRRSGPRAALRRLRVAVLPVPGQALALTLLAVVLAAALVSVPLTIGAAEEGAWQRERGRQAEADVGTQLFSSTLPPALQPQPGRIRIPRAADLDAAVADAAAAVGLGRPLFQAHLRGAAGTPVGEDFLRVQLVSRSGWQENVRIEDGEVAEGAVVVPRSLATAADVGPGDQLQLVGVEGLDAAVAVSGVYTDIAAPLPEFWAAQGGLFLPSLDPRRGRAVTPPPAVLATQDTVLATAAAIEQDLFLEWFLPLPAGISVDEARSVARRVDRLHVVLADPSSEASRLQSLMGFERPAPQSDLPDMLAAADRTVRLLEPPVRAVGVGGGVAAVVLIGAWAALRVRRRTDELRMLLVRGMAPTRGGGHAVREAVVPLALGGVLGAGVGWLLVRTFGPSARFPDGTVADAALAVAAGCLAALAVVLVVTTVLVLRLDRLGTGPVAAALGRIPWLAVTAAVTLVTAVPLVTDLVGGGPTEADADLLVMALPLLVTVLVAGAVTAVLPRVTRSSRRSTRLPPAVFLALQRVVSARGPARLIVVTTALSMGLVVYAGALAESADRSIAAKSAVAAGSRTVVPLQRSTADVDPLPPGSTLVGTERSVTVAPGELQADLLALDPDEVGEVMQWDPSLADRPLDELLGALAGYVGDRVPVLVAGPAPGVDTRTGTDLALDFFSFYELPLEVVGRLDAWPGQAGRTPLLVTAWEPVLAALEAEDVDPARVFDQQVWSTDESAPLLAALGAAGYGYEPAEVRTAAEFTTRPEVLAQDWSLDFGRAAALAAGLLGLVAVAMYAFAQQRRRRLSSLLLFRMGLAPRAADTAAGLEIGLLAGIGALVAVAVALPASAVITPVLDPAPGLLPGPLFAVPVGSLAAVLGGVVGVTLGAAVLVGRSSRSAPAGEVLRDAA